MGDLHQKAPVFSEVDDSNCLFGGTFKMKYFVAEEAFHNQGHLPNLTTYYIEPPMFLPNAACELSNDYCCLLQDWSMQMNNTCLQFNSDKYFNRDVDSGHHDVGYFFKRNKDLSILAYRNYISILKQRGISTWDLIENMPAMHDIFLREACFKTL